MRSYFKCKTQRSIKYEKYVREQPCIICGSRAVVHHAESNGMGLKCSSFRTIPLCVYHHTGSNNSIHKLGRENFENLHCINLDKVIIELLEEYIREIE